MIFDYWIWNYFNCMYVTVATKFMNAAKIMTKVLFDRDEGLEAWLALFHLKNLSNLDYSVVSSFRSI